MMACCNARDIDPFQWLRDVLTRIPNTPQEKLDDLLPHNWTQQVFDIPRERFHYPLPKDSLN